MHAASNSVETLTRRAKGYTRNPTNSQTQNQQPSIRAQCVPPQHYAKARTRAKKTGITCACMIGKPNIPRLSSSFVLHSPRPSCQQDRPEEPLLVAALSSSRGPRFRHHTPKTVRRRSCSTEGNLYACPCETCGGTPPPFSTGGRCRRCRHCCCCLWC